VSKYRGNQWLILVTLSLGFFMTLLDLSIVNIAFPNMISKLHASLNDILWVVNAYALTVAVLLITAGRLGDKFGQRRMFIAGIIAFTIASGGCGLAPSAGWLIGFRAVQGVGAAMLLPQTLAMLTMVFPPERRGAAFGIWGAVSGLASVAGPTLGGLLVTAFDWRYIFFVNLPIGLLVFVLSVTFIPDLRANRDHHLDISGVLVSTAALLAICYGLVEGQRYSWGKITSFISIPLVLGCGVALLAVFLVMEARKQDREPLVPLSLFRDRNYSLMNFAAGAVAFGILGIFVPFTIYLQSVLGFTALKAGLTFAPAAVISMVVAPVAGRMSDRLGGKYILMAGLTLFAAGIAWIDVIARTNSVWYVFLPPQLVIGVGVGCTFAPMITLAMHSIDPRMAGAASGVLNTTRQVGTLIGAAGVGALLENRLVYAFTAQTIQRAAGLSAPARAKIIAGFQEAARSGLDVGSGKKPAGLTGQIFTHGFVQAMRPTMAVPILILLAGAASCVVVRRRLPRPGTEPAPGSPLHSRRQPPEPVS
jgi:EmrB/QacA subfamily drug resistance transporter